MQHVSRIRIRNYRSCADLTLKLSDMTPLVGRNNAGKSNIIAALSWLLRPTALRADDFWDPSQSLSVAVSLPGIDALENEALSPAQRGKLEPFLNAGALELRRRQTEPGGTLRGVGLELRDAAGEWQPAPAGVDAAVKTLLPEPIEVGAMENAAEDVGKYKASSTIGRLIGAVAGSIEARHGERLQDALATVERTLAVDGAEKAPELVELDEGATEALKELFPGIELRVHVPAPKLSDLFKTGTVRVFETGAETGRDISAVGHGTQRSIQMALIRYLAERSAGKEATTTRRMLLVDEPELYLHPQSIEQVRAAFKALAAQGYQVLFATHSPLMIAVEDVPNTIIVGQEAGRGTQARRRMGDAMERSLSAAGAQAQALFRPDNAARILFSNHVLVAEGDTEALLLPLIFERTMGRTLTAARVGLVAPGGSGNIGSCLRILESMGLPCSGLADLDFAFRDAVKHGLLDSEDPDIAACRRILAERAEEAGLELGGDGFPIKRSKQPGFRLLAEDPEGAVHVSNLHEKLKAEREIWLWTKGDIEAHLGLRSKKRSSRNAFAARIQAEGCGCIEDPTAVEELCRWIAEAGTGDRPAGSNLDESKVGG